MGENRIPIKVVYLAAGFTALLTISNVIASRLVSLDLWIAQVLVPLGVVAYPFTFTVTDIAGEVYGKKAASLIVKTGFAAQLLAFALIITSLAAATPGNLPGFIPGQENIDQSLHTLLGLSPTLIIASITAYLASQFHDVWAFHMWREKTQGRWLWLRNNASTLVSQLIDTVVFIGLAFTLLPAASNALLDTAIHVIPPGQALQLMAGQYLVKAIIALIDTPIVYLGVHMLRRNP